MKNLWPLGLPLLLALSLPSHEGAGGEEGGRKRGGVAISPEKRYYYTGEEVKGAIRNGTGGPIFLQGCNPFVLEYLSEEGYIPVKEKKCPSEKAAIRVDPGEFLPDFSIRLEGRGYFRIILAFGSGCREGRSLSTAACSDFHTIRSSPFLVRGRVEEDG